MWLREAEEPPRGWLLIDYMEGGLPQLMGEACANPASYNLCGPAVGWTKSSLCDVRALNRAWDCTFLCAGKWFAQWILGFFLVSFPTKEHRAETRRIFLYLPGSVSWARCNYHFLLSSQLTEKFPRQKRKHIDQKKKKKNHDTRTKHKCPLPCSSIWKNELSGKGTWIHSSTGGHACGFQLRKIGKPCSSVCALRSCVCPCALVCRWGCGAGLKRTAVAQTGWEFIFVWNQMHSELDKMKNFIQHFLKEATQGLLSQHLGQQMPPKSHRLCPHTHICNFSYPPHDQNGFAPFSGKPQHLLHLFLK